MALKKIDGRARWTEKEVQYLRDNMSAPVAELAKNLHKTESATFRRLQRLIEADRESMKENDIICPFYKQRGGTSCLCCESLFGEMNRISFRTTADCAIYFNTYCRSYNYKNCPQSRALNLIKYGISED